jgi:hypothetical protein
MLLSTKTNFHDINFKIPVLVFWIEYTAQPYRLAKQFQRIMMCQFAGMECVGRGIGWQFAVKVVTGSKGGGE